MNDKTIETQQALIEAQQDPDRPNIAAIYDGAKIVYVNARTKVIVTCATHSDFDILPRDIVRRSYLCPECHKESKSKKLDNKAEALKAAIVKRHGDKFDFTLFDYKDSQTQVTLRCKTHDHITELFPYDVERRVHICEQCKSDAAHGTRTELVTFLEKARAIHGERYNYSPTDYQGALAPITILCNNHGPFELPASSHLSGRGCQKCGYEQAALKKTGVKQDRRIFEPSEDALDSSNIYLQEYVAFRLNKAPAISFDLFGDVSGLSPKELQGKLREPAFSGECKIVLGTNSRGEPNDVNKSTTHELNSPTYLKIFRLCEAHYGEHDGKIDHRRPLAPISFDPNIQTFSFCVDQSKPENRYSNKRREANQVTPSVFTPSDKALECNIEYLDEYLSFRLKENTELNFCLFRNIKSISHEEIRARLRTTAIKGECKLILGTRNLGDTSSFRRTKKYLLESPTYLEIFKVCDTHYREYNNYDDHRLLESIHLKNAERNNNAYVVFAGS